MNNTNFQTKHVKEKSVYILTVVTIVFDLEVTVI